MFCAISSFRLDLFQLRLLKIYKRKILRKRMKVSEKGGRGKKGGSEEGGEGGEGGKEAKGKKRGGGKEGGGGGDSSAENSYSQHMNNLLQRHQSHSLGYYF